MKNVYLIILIFLVGFTTGDVNFLFRKLNWEFDKTIDSTGESRNVLYFDGCLYNEGNNFLPVYVETLKPEFNKGYNVEIINAVYKKFNANGKDFVFEKISDTLQVTKNLEISRGEYYLKLEILPFKKINGEVYLLSAFGIKLLSHNEINNKKSAVLWESESVLKGGSWIKVKTTKKGIHRIPYSRLQEWGFANPQNVKIFSNGGYILPESNAINGNDGLNQVSVWKGKDGSGNDCLFFYSTGNTKWDWDQASKSFKHTTNIYSRATYFFLTENVGTLKEVTSFSPVDNESNVTINSFDEYSVYEQERNNLIRSGRQWFGERFVSGTNNTFNINCAGREENSPVQFNINSVGRASITSSMNFSLNSEYKTGVVFNAVNTGDETALYADEKNVSIETGQSGNSFDVKMAYSAVNLEDNTVNTSAEAWLDYIRVNYRKNLNYTSPEMYFRDAKSLGADKIADCNISNAINGLKVFDVTDGINIYEIPATLNGSTLKFKRPANELREYVVFTPESNFSEPEKVGEVANQNLHAIPVPEMIVITHPDFYDVANELADFHRSYDGMSVEVVKTTEVFNEFSSGMADASGIRNFIRMLYNRDSNKLKYALLFGDGSYDNRNIKALNKNFIPTYQSLNSLLPTSSFVTDDYYVILDEGESVHNGAVDVGIGRIPASTIYEAQIVLNKVKDYNSSESLGNWRNEVCFIGDDEDGSVHMRDSETLANKINAEHGAFLTSKIYFDAYPKDATSAGGRYPDVTESINNHVKDGVLILNYVGHANDRYLAKENVLGVSDINSWSNKNNLPIFMTATCEFSRFDSDESSAGEYVLFNPSGGGIGLFSTTRVVYAYSNFLLSQSFYNYVFEQDKTGNHYRMGDIIRLAKVNTNSSINKRNFSLLADPALRLSYPKYQVITSKINSKDAGSAADTIKALNKITIEGYIADYSGNKLSGFNGDITPIVYDKAFMLKTMGNGGQTPFEFKVQDNIIYKGLASVVNGEFSFSFMVPKDIAYNLGKGKIVYYAKNETEDAHGSFENFLIGGSTNGQISDNTGPDVNLFLDDETFKPGDKTSKNPLLLVHVSDENGINTVGTGIGHDITAVIDDEVSNIYILNDYYKSAIDDYKSGKIEFPLKNLPEGKHTLKFKIWDVANNSTEVEINFVVSGDFYIEEVSNYPNPISSYTFFSFKHNQPDATFKGLIEIFDRNGRLVDYFSSTISSNGMESNPVRWDVSDADMAITSGIYIYRISIKSSDGLIASKSGKMSFIR